jgi:ribosomal protein L37E
MIPKKNLIKLSDNRAQLRKMLFELVLTPRLRAIEWSRITKQTPNIKIGYPGQHLASLITGMQGERTGARGNDLVDGSEVKACSRIDQLDKCKRCGDGVARLEDTCSSCGSDKIKRNNDSKWLFTIRTESELDTLLHRVGRVVLVLGDYKSFDSGDYDTLRFQAFEIWPESPRNRRFAEIMTNYYKKIYLEHKKHDANKTPAPKNFWPDQYQFYMCNPIRTFLCEVKQANSDPKLTIKEYVDPDADRSRLPSILMPIETLTAEELGIVESRATLAELRAALPPGAQLPAGAGKSEVVRKLTHLTEELRNCLSLRDTDKISVAKSAYVRRGFG